MAALIDQLNNKIKDTIPAVKEGGTISANYPVKEDNPEKASVDLGKLSGKNLIVGVPGPFTPPCSSHVPGYIQQIDAIKAKGIKDVYIVTVNDLFCTQAWAEKLGAKDTSNLHFVADDTGAFTGSLGLLFDASGLLGNARSQRYVIVAENNTVSKIFIEDAAPNVEKTKADTVLSAL